MQLPFWRERAAVRSPQAWMPDSGAQAANPGSMVAIAAVGLGEAAPGRAVDGMGPQDGPEPWDFRGYVRRQSGEIS